MNRHAFTRRHVLGGVVAGTALTMMPHGARSQSSDLPVIAFVSVRNFNPAGIAAFTEGLAEQGWIVGDNVRLEMVFTTDDEAGWNEGARRAVASEPQLLAGIGGQSARALLAATSSIPIVFCNVFDPVAQGLVDNLARPGGNATGSYLGPVLAGQRIEMLQLLVPDLSMVGYLTHAPSENPPVLAGYAQAIADAGLDYIELPVNDIAEVPGLLGAYSLVGSFGVLVSSNGGFYYERRRLIDAVNSTSVPASYYWAEQAHEGGLMSFGPDSLASMRISGSHAGQILNGTTPADLPVRATSNARLVLNFATANEQRVAFPSSLIAIADEVIE